MKTKFNDDLFRLCHPVGQLRELNRRADLGAIEEKLEHLRRVKGLRMKLVTVDDFLTWHNNAGGFLRYPVIVQLDNDPPHERELSLYFFSCFDGGKGLYGYWGSKQDLDFNKMIVVGFHPITVKDCEFFAELGVNTDSGFMMLVKAHPIEVFEETEL